MLILGKKSFLKTKPDRSSVLISFLFAHVSKCLQRGLNPERISGFSPRETLEGPPEFRPFVKKSLAFEQRIEGLSTRSMASSCLAISPSF